MDASDPRTPQGDGEAGAGGFPGAEVLRGRSPKEVLHRLLDHDPFELRGRSQARIEARAFLLSVRRVWLRTLARVAYAAMRYIGQPPIEEWLEERIDVAIEEILREDVDAELASEPLERPYESHLVFVCENFGVEIATARRACLRFNALPDSVRRTFFAIAVQRKSLHRWVAEGNGPPARIEQDIERAIRSLAAFPDPDDLDLSDVSW